MEQSIIDFDNSEREWLAASMPPKEMAVCHETLHTMLKSIWALSIGRTCFTFSMRSSKGTSAVLASKKKKAEMRPKQAAEEVDCCIQVQ